MYAFLTQVNSFTFSSFNIIYSQIYWVSKISI